VRGGNEAERNLLSNGQRPSTASAPSHHRVLIRIARHSAAPLKARPCVAVAGPDLGPRSVLARYRRGAHERLCLALHIRCTVVVKHYRNITPQPGMSDFRRTPDRLFLGSRSKAPLHSIQESLTTLPQGASHFALLAQYNSTYKLHSFYSEKNETIVPIIVVPMFYSNSPMV
jgi:hypothetical protein